MQGHLTSQPEASGLLCKQPTTCQCTCFWHKTEITNLSSQSSPLWGCRRERGTLWPLSNKARLCCWAWWWPKTPCHTHSHPPGACQEGGDREAPLNSKKGGNSLSQHLKRLILLTRKCRRHRWQHLSYHSRVRRTACPQGSCLWRCKSC